MPCWTRQLWPHNLNQTVSGKAGAVQYDFIIPSAYRFNEQLLLGEYEHNLKVLAELIAEGLRSNEKADPGIVGRAARKLEHMTFSHLKVLAATRITLDRMDFRDPGEDRFLRVENVFAVLNEAGDSHLEDIAEGLHELSIRGLLIHHPPSGFFKGGFSTSSVYHELISAVRSVLDGERPK